MPDEIKKQSWYDKQTNRVKRLTVWFAFIITFSTLWGILKFAGMDLLNVTVGCSSTASLSEENAKRIDTLKVTVDTNYGNFLKSKTRRKRFESQADSIFKTEKKSRNEQ